MVTEESTLRETVIDRIIASLEEAADKEPLEFNWDRGYHAGLKVARQIVREQHLTVLAFAGQVEALARAEGRFPTVLERAASLADFGDWQENERRLAWGDR